MAKYRKKPVVVEAEQFHAMQWPDCPEGIERRTANETDVEGETTGRGCEWFVLKLKGAELHITNGDWVITQKGGHKRICSNDYFEATYEKVED